MKIGEILQNVLDQLSSHTLDINKETDQCLTASVNPKYKDVITFLLDCSISTLAKPYNEIKTEISSDPFSYEMRGNLDKVKLVVPTYRFSMHNGNLEDFLNNLQPAIQKLIKDLSCGWNYSSEWIDNGSVYENTNLSGTYYAFLLENVAKIMGLNNGIFISAWAPGSGWNFADKIYLRGNDEQIKQFISSISSELFMQPADENKESSNVTFSSSTSSKVIFLNSAFNGNATIKVTNAPKGTTFIQFMTSRNQQQSDLDSVTHSEETQSINLK